jgi:arylsulfatase A-like enzyme
MDRRSFLKTSLGCTLAAAAQRSFAATSPPLNVVLIVADDLGWADLACYGADLHETPNLDRLAREGMRFTDAYAAAPVCTPTRASIMTGKSPARLHTTIWYEASARPPANKPLLPPITQGNLPQGDVTLAEAFHAAGYLTAHVGKWHLGDAGNYPEVHGFDINIGGTFWGAPQTFFYPYRGDTYFGGEYRYVPQLHGGKEGEYLTDRLTDEAIAILEDARDKPFFLYMAYHSVHTPIEGKPELVAHYQAKLRPGLRHQNPTYAAMVHSLDENVGRILDALARLGIADRTLVLFVSDNGGLIDERAGVSVTDNFPLRSGKGSLYEGGVRVPMLVRWPGVTAPGSTCTQPVISTDFYPTLLEAARIESDDTQTAALEGRSLVPALREPLMSLSRAGDGLYFHYPHYYATTTPVSAVRSGDWKLLEYFEDQRLELYNLAEDLGETSNLAEKHPETAQALRDALHRWRKQVDAQMPTSNPDYRRRP